jgi:NADH-quinone oxidoreductase subunit J
MVAQLLFFFLAIVAIAAGIGMIASRSPVTSALWLILNLFCVAGLYLTMNAEFIGVIQVLVYAGAIMVLFLFVIMLLNLSAIPALHAFDWKRGVGFLLATLVLAQLVFAVARGLDLLPQQVAAAEAARTGTAEALGKELFTRYVLPLEIIGVLLLAATIGAVMIAKRRFV